MLFWHQASPYTFRLRHDKCGKGLSFGGHLSLLVGIHATPRRGIVIIRTLLRSSELVSFGPGEQ